MTDLTKANEARANTVLDRKRQFSAGIFSFREMIDDGMFDCAEVVQVPQVNYNRRKFNRMDAKEQREYEAKMAKMKNEYRLYYAHNNDVFVSVPKIVFDYYRNRKG